jgi:alanine-glyoxylate transaminase/serine-glyoxylate transaminase/serine-pyruvate transaminase
MPSGQNADNFREVVLNSCNMSLGTGLGKVAGKVFRIGHLGACNDLILLGALGGIEIGLDVGGIPHSSGGVDAARRYLANSGNESCSQEMAVAGQS